MEVREVEVLLALGSNLGNRTENINKAITLLQTNEVLKNVKVSSFYETEPKGYENQPRFINAVVTGLTSLTPLNLLMKCKEIEKNIGRKKRPKWHAREIDIDIILYGKLQHFSEELVIPHPHFRERLFVLLPSNEIASDWIDPLSGKTIHTLYNELLIFANNS
ncbi:MAG: 2-amino-4-hydroxy-6-hydroxymethyldihydropteridine diphosphokinase [Ignavibacteria bacterium]|nr:2-amino-4-hydroxy-6-hydroxymethyldihydropteridine diphosphokinase [Ignavibacteria bacterium]